MAQNEKPGPASTGDHIISIPTPPTDGQESYYRKSVERTMAERREIAQGTGKADDSKTETSASSKNVYLDGEAKQKTKLQQLKPFIYRISFLVVGGLLLSIPIIIGKTSPSGKKASVDGPSLVWFFAWVSYFFSSSGF